MTSSLRPIKFVWHGKLDDFNTSLAWSPDGTRLAVGSVSGQVAIYDAAQGKALHLLERPMPMAATRVAWRADGAGAGHGGSRRQVAAVGCGRRQDSRRARGRRDVAGTSRVERPSRSANAARCWPSARVARLTLWNEKGEPAGEPIKFPKTIAEVAWIMGGADAGRRDQHGESSCAIPPRARRSASSPRATRS